MIDNGNQDYYDFGEKIGEASVKVLIGKNDYKAKTFSGDPKPPAKDTKV